MRLCRVQKGLLVSLTWTGAALYLEHLFARSKEVHDDLPAFTFTFSMEVGWKMVVGVEPDVQTREGERVDFPHMSGC